MSATRDPLPLVLIPDDPGREAVDRVRAALEGVAQVHALPPPGPERSALLGRAEVLLVFTWGLASEELEALRAVRFVQSVWAGVDRIPARALAVHAPELQVAGGSDANATQVAEHAVALYLDCAKRVSWRDRQMRGGAFPQETPGQRVAGSRIAVVGHGAIGGRVADALEALGAEVVGVTRSGRGDGERAMTDLAGLRDQLGSFAGVVLTLPLTRETEGMVDAAWLRAMPSDGILVNVARGRLIVEEDLHAHLVAHPGFQAGLDVWWRYPKPPGRVGFVPKVPFPELDNVVMTPHSAFHVPGTRQEMMDSAAANVRRFLQGAPPERLVRIEDCVR